MFPLKSINKGNFQDAFRSKLCLGRPVLNENLNGDIVRQNIVPMISQFLVSIFCWYWTLKTNQHLRGICPDRKMSSIGKYRRNFTTFEETTRYIKTNYYYLLFHQGLIFSLIQAVFTVTPETNFLLSNTCDFVYIGVYHGIFLPSKMTIPSKKNRQRLYSDFFVRKPQFLEPRRHMHINDYLGKDCFALRSVPICKSESLQIDEKEGKICSAFLTTDVLLNQVEVRTSPAKLKTRPTDIGLPERKPIETLCCSTEIRSGAKLDGFLPVSPPVPILVTPWREKERNL